PVQKKLPAETRDSAKVQSRSKVPGAGLPLARPPSAALLQPGTSAASPVARSPRPFPVPTPSVLVPRALVFQYLAAFSPGPARRADGEFRLGTSSRLPRQTVPRRWLRPAPVGTIDPTPPSLAGFRSAGPARPRCASLQEIGPSPAAS